MDLLSRIASWLGENEATISAVVGIAVLTGIALAGLRSLVRRRAGAAPEKTPTSTAEPASATSSAASDLDPLTVPGFEGRPAIAVLPFDDLSSEHDQEYFADGIAEDLITRLSAWQSFPVIARNSSFIYKGMPVDVKRVSRELGVRYVVEGSVRKAADRVRISAQLIDATTGAHVWAETYDRDLGAIFTVQDEISEAVAGSIYPQLVKSEQDRAARKKPQDLDAWETHWRGWWHYAKLTEQDNAKARLLFQSAIDQDPEFALAFAGLAFTHNGDVLHQWSESPTRSITELERAARQAMFLDSSEPMAQLALGLAYRLTGDMKKAAAAFEAAVQLDPSLAAGWYFLAGVLATTGRPDEAIANTEKAIRLSPHDPWMHGFFTTIAMGHVAARRPEEAVEWAQRALQRRPDYLLAYTVLAGCFAYLGRLDEARKAVTEITRLNPSFSLAGVKLFLSDADPAYLEMVTNSLLKAGLKE